MTFNKVYGKSRIIKLRSEEAIIDGNTIQTPFLAPYRIKKNKETGALEPITSVNYQWETVENGVVVTRGVEVSGHGKLGVPTLKDKKVLRALQNIYIWSKVNDGVLELETDPKKVTEEDLMIDFKNIDNLAREMGYNKISGQQRKAIKESIERLVATTVFSTHQGGLYDAITKKYITNSKISYRYLESMKDYTVYDCENCLYLHGCNKNHENCMNEDKKTDVTKIKMSMFTYLNIAHNYRLYYNKDNANMIRNLIAEDIYLISRKWLGNGSVSKANIKKYIERIPMETKKEYHKKQAIKEAVENLNSYDFVEAYVENDIVTVKHLDKIPSKRSNKNKDKIPSDVNDTTYMKDRFLTYVDIIEGLKGLGLEESEINNIFGDLQRIEYIKALLRYVYLHIKYNPKTNGKDYFLNCFNKNIDIDKKYYTEIK